MVLLRFGVGCDVALYCIIFVFVYFLIFIFGCIIFNTQQNQTILLFVYLYLVYCIFLNLSISTFFANAELLAYNISWIISISMFPFPIRRSFKIFNNPKIQITFSKFVTFLRSSSILVFFLLLLFQLFMQSYRIIIVSNLFPMNCRKYEKKNPIFIIHFCLIVPLCDTIYSLT